MSDNIPLLSITIPTYNRAGYLSILLDSILSQIEGYKDEVEVIICDNASSDNTGQVVESFMSHYSSAKYIRNDENIGMDGNFKKCFDSANGVYVWMIGDDDRLNENALIGIFTLLRQDKHIDLLYLSSTIKEYSPCRTLNYSTITSGLGFIKETGIMFTFISGIIFNKSHYMAYPAENRCEMVNGTFLLHLYWQLCLLRYGQKFIFVHNAMIYATADNSGGYRLFSVFSKNLSVLLDVFFKRDDKISKRLRLSSAFFLLNFLNNTAKTKSFDVNDYVSDCDKAFKDLLIYRYFLRFFYVNPDAIKYVIKIKSMLKKMLRK